GKDATLTGRTEIWDGISRVVAERPLTGYGYGVVWEDESPFAPLAKITKVAGFRAYHAHSGWYEVWLEMGIIGLIVWSLTYGEAVLRALVSAFRNPGAYLALPVFIVYGLMTLTESVTLSYNDIRWVLFCTLLVRLSLPEPRPDPYARPTQTGPFDPPVRRGFRPDVWPPRQP
ncbi:MAG: O-antigen ligase family protein, partial [Asticcacaulis sp.]